MKRLLYIYSINVAAFNNLCTELFVSLLALTN